MTRKALPVLWVCVRVQFLQTFLLLPIRFFAHTRMFVSTSFVALVAPIAQSLLWPSF